MSGAASPAGALERLRALYPRPLYLRAFAAIRLWHAGYDMVEAQLPRTGRILDLGCGYGLFANYLALASPDREVLGVDVDSRKLGLADRGVGGVSFRRVDVLEDPPPGDYDGVALLHVLHHLGSFADQERMLRWCAGRLRPGGRLVILEVERCPWWKFLAAWLTDHLLYLGDRIYFRDRPEMLALLGGLGLEAEASSLHQGRPFPHVLYVCRRAHSPGRR